MIKKNKEKVFLSVDKSWYILKVADKSILEVILLDMDKFNMIPNLS